MDFMVLGKITRGRHTDNPSERHSIQTNQQSTSINPAIFTPDALSVATLPIYPGLGQTGICWIAYPHGLVSFYIEIQANYKQIMQGVKF